MPHDMPLVVGTEQIADHERARSAAAPSRVIEPPVDVVAQRARRRRRRRVPPRAPARPRRADRRLRHPAGRRAQARGPARRDRRVGGPRPRRRPARHRRRRARAAPRSRRAAERANAAAGRRAVVLTGELRDPRPAYAAADVCARHGRLCAARAWPSRRPLVVQGEQGFWELLTPGDRRALPVDRLVRGRRRAASTARPGWRRSCAGCSTTPAAARSLGAYARELVRGPLLARSARGDAAARALRARGRPSCRGPARSCSRPGGASARQARGLPRRSAGSTRFAARFSADDFNARPVAGQRAA